MTEEERQQILTEIERLKQLEIDNGDRDRWEATQPGFRLERILAELNRERGNAQTKHS